jgi:threonine/homoserine/homoserine lactone efflux protein
VLLNLLNPKLTIFAFAFLPQFVPSGSPNALARLLELSGVFMLTTFVVFAIYGVCAAAIRSHVMSRPAVVTWMRRVFGVSFIALAARLAVQNQ